MPGLVNAHIHSPLTICRGAVHDVPELEYMFKGLRIFANHLKPSDFVLGTKIAVLEGIRTGTTTFAEYGIGVDSLVNQVYLLLKTRVVATEMINELDYTDKQKSNALYEFKEFIGKNAFKRAQRLINKYKDEDLVETMFGPHALDMLSLELLKEIKQLSLEKGIKYHMHIAQRNRERIQIQNRYGKNNTTIKVLQSNDLLCTNLIAAHIHDTTVQERKLLVSKGVNMVGCPSSISKIDGIIPPIGSYKKLGGKVGIGTDEAPGSGHHNLLNEIKMACILSKIAFKDPTALPPWEVIRSVTIEGAEILDLQDKIGSLKVGKTADIITINLCNVNIIPVIDNPFNNIIANLVYSSKGTEVDNVIINGNLIMNNEKMQNINEEMLLKEANKRAREIFESATKDWISAGSRMVDYHKFGYI